jgi:hypothetical protein
MTNPSLSFLLHVFDLPSWNRPAGVFRKRL